MHEPYVELNAALIESLESGDIPSATGKIESYLLLSERGILAALHRKRKTIKKAESGSAKTGHGSGGIVLPRAE